MVIFRLLLHEAVFCASIQSQSASWHLAMWQLNKGAVA